MASFRTRTYTVPRIDPIEERLNEQLQKVNIVGELEVDQDLYTKLHRFYNHHISRRSLDRLIKRYPASFVVHLVAEGVYGYEGGNYWDDTPLKQQGTQNELSFGKKQFEALVDSYGLESFPDRNPNRRYVSLILLHTGIPNSELPSFFEYAIVPAVYDAQWTGARSTELVRRWPEEPPTSYRLSKTVHTFLREGGDVAVDFVERCVEMAKRTAETGDLPSTSEARLPHRIVDAFKTWWQKEAKSTTRRPKERRKESAQKAPSLWLDPQLPQVMVNLPAQRFEGVAGTPNVKVRWEVQPERRTDAVRSQVDVHVYRSNEQWACEAESIPVEMPARAYTVSLLGSVRPVSWSFEGVSPGRRLLAFDAETLEMLEAPQVLPARPLWLVYPAEATLEVPGGREIEAERPCHGEWSEYRTVCWDLTSAKHVRIDTTTWGVVRSGQSLQPLLVGGEELAIGGHRDRYFTELPEVRIPVAADRNVEEAPAQWDLVVSANGNQKTFELSDLSVCLLPEEQALTLALREIVEAEGDYQLSVRGPLGRSVHYEFTYVGNCSVFAPKRPRVPDESGAYPVATVHLRTTSGRKVASENVGVEVVSEGDGQHRLEVDGTCTQTAVQLIPLAGGEPIRLPLAVPGIHWALHEADKTGTWSTRPIRRVINALDQVSQANLVVRLKPSSREMTLDGALEVWDGHQLVQRLKSKSRAGSQLRFDLRELRDTIATADRTYDVRLSLDTGQACSVLRLEPVLDLSEIALATRQVGDDWNLDLSWKAKGEPVKNRCLRLWSEGRPWESPHTFHIPDEAHEHARFTIPISELKAGPYLAVIELEDPWAAREPERPKRDGQNVGRVHVGSAAHQLQRAWQDEASLEFHLECAFLSDSATDASRHLSKANRARVRSDLPLLLRALWWMDSTEPLVDQSLNQRGVVTKWLVEQVVREPEDVLATLADDPLYADRQDRLHQFIIELGLYQALKPLDDKIGALDAAWRLWDTMGWVVSTSALLTGHVRYLRMAERSIGLSELRCEVSEEEVHDSVFEEWCDLSEETEAFGGRIGIHEAEMPAAVLEQQRRQLYVSLRGYFDDEKSWLAVNFDWLIRYKRRKKKYGSYVEILYQYRGPLKAGVQRLAELDGQAQGTAKAILERHNPLEEARLPNVPFWIGATALLQRCKALFEIELPFAQPEQLIQCGLAAYQLASPLYERDLCLISLSLSQQELSRIDTESPVQ